MDFGKTKDEKIIYDVSRRNRGKSRNCENGECGKPGNTLDSLRSGITQSTPFVRADSLGRRAVIRDGRDIYRESVARRAAI